MAATTISSDFGAQKILQARLQKYVKHELSDVQVDLEKTEEL